MSNLNQMFPSSSVYINQSNDIKYFGSVNEYNLPHGEGSVYYDDILVYQGKVKYGYYHGYGVEYDKNNNITYAGFFKYGKKHGSGREYLDGQVLYNGKWKNDVYHGFGIYYGVGKYHNNKDKFIDGEIYYKGKWKNGNRHGLGICYFNKKPSYYGEWKNDKKHGIGIQYDSNNNIVYDGEWVDGSTTVDWYDCDSIETSN